MTRESHLRPYQAQAAQVFDDHMASSTERRVAFEMATGLGKTVTGSAVAARRNSAVIFTPTEEITSQWEANLAFATRGTNATVGVVQADRDEPSADFVIASVATVANPERMARIGRRDLNIVDECHHSVARTWLQTLRTAGAWDGVPTLGLTATLARSDGQGLGHVWENMIFSRGITWAQRHGYLLDIQPWKVTVPDISALSSDAALDAALATSIAPEVVVDTWRERAAGRSTVLFAPLVKSAQSFCDAFHAAGISAEVIHGGSPDRAGILERYESGRTTVLCNAMVLKEGWDSPRTMCVIWARPTPNVPLFVQGVGRGLRPWLAAEAPPRDEQVCVLIGVVDTSGARIASVADLSTKPLADVADGKTLLEAEDEYDLGGIIEGEIGHEYDGPVRVDEWDLKVQQSSKAWKFTKMGAPFLPTAKRSQGYVFVVGSDVFLYGPHPSNPRRMGARKVGSAPDASLAVALAEDEAQERGGDIGALLADKGRPWRKAVPSMDMQAMALRSGVSQKELDRIMSDRASGKAGKLSDLTDRMIASKLLDPIVVKIQKR